MLQDSEVRVEGYVSGAGRYGSGFTSEDSILHSLLQALRFGSSNSHLELWGLGVQLCMQGYPSGFLLDWLPLIHVEPYSALTCFRMYVDYKENCQGASRGFCKTTPAFGLCNSRNEDV